MDKVFTELIAKMLGTPAEQVEQALIEVKNKIETNTAISASIVGKMYNNICGISDKKKPQCKANIEQKIIQMSASNTAAMLQNMADIRKEQKHQYQERRNDHDNI